MCLIIIVVILRLFYLFFFKGLSERVAIQIRCFFTVLNWLQLDRASTKHHTFSIAAVIGTVTHLALSSPYVADPHALRVQFLLKHFHNGISIMGYTISGLSLKYTDRTVESRWQHLLQIRETTIAFNPKIKYWVLDECKNCYRNNKV